jgi:signal transduction histidine kinase
VTRSEFVDRWKALWRRTGATPLPSRWAWAADAILAAALLVGVLDGTSRRSDTVLFVEPVPQLGGAGPVFVAPPDAPFPGAHAYYYPPVHWWDVVIAVLTVLPLVARRRYPLAVFWTVILSTVLYHLKGGFDPTFTFTACVIAAYSLIMNSVYPGIAIMSVLIGAGLIIEDHRDTVPSFRPELVSLALLIPIALVANAIHTWKQRVRSLELEQTAATRLAVERERARIASELHDVITHNVSVMVVQAGAARKVMDTSPDRAREALLAVESGGRAAMTELRHAMGLLTMDQGLPDPIPMGTTGDRAVGLDRGGGPGRAGGLDGDDPSAAGSEGHATASFGTGGSFGVSDGGDVADPRPEDPAPGLDRLASLVDRVRQTGVPVELRVIGSPAALSPGADLAAYRVVQEAMTNTVKHASGARVRVTINHGPRELRVEVTDTGGTPTPAARAGNGHGLIGLRERLAVYGGTLTAGQRPTGGYRVSAMIPLVDS